MDSLIQPICTLLRVLALAITLVLLRGIVYLVNLLVILPRFDPLRNVDGPEAKFFESQFSEATNPQNSPEAFVKWKKSHGNTFRFNGLGKFDYRLMTFDLRALAHIFTSPTYEKPWQTRVFLSKLIGRGIFSTEGHEHKLQRKLIGPAFSSQVVKNLSPMFLDKAEQLSQLWDKQLGSEESTDDKDASVVDVTRGLSRMTFDIIGLGGFDYGFNSLEDEGEPVHMAFRRMFRTLDEEMGPRELIELYYPILTKVWPTEANKIVASSLKEIGQAVQEIITRKKEQLLTRGEDNKPKDILGLLIKANMASEASARLTDEELSDQCRTFLLAGSDSSSVAMSWCLHFLANNPEIQSRLYSDIQTSIKEAKLNEDYDSDGSDDSGFAEDPMFKNEAATARSRTTYINLLESMPYLNGVVKETLRLCPPVHSTIRVATADDEIPLSEPIEVAGQKVSSVKIRKGTFIHLPIEGVNQSEDIWGADVNEFKPSRWEKLPDRVGSPNYPGLGHLITFGYGNSSCLGSRFTLSEMKIAIATVVAKFEFLPVEGVEVDKYHCVITRPYVEGRWEEGTQLPLRLRRRP